MLQIFADSLLIATRQEPFRPDPSRSRPVRATDDVRRRSWFALVGLKR